MAHTPDARFLETTPDRIRGLAPAKVNLFLEVTGRYPDGYHELVTVFHEIDVADSVDIEQCEAAADQLAVSGIDLDVEPGENLVMKAIGAFRAEVGPCPPVQIHLQKCIAPGSGMGGGSSDAAFVLAALTLVTGAASQTDQLPGIARGLGADVPFFLLGGSAVGRARGDELQPLSGVPQLFLALAFPRFSLSTAEVYGAVSLTESRREVKPFLEELGGSAGGENIHCFNRLEVAAFLIEPGLRSIRDELQHRTRAPWTLTGTGSVLFSAFRTRERRDRALEALADWGDTDIGAAQSFRRLPNGEPAG